MIDLPDTCVTNRQNAAKIVMTCAILHNICVQHRLPVLDDEDADVDDEDEVNGIDKRIYARQRPNAEGLRIRRQLIIDRFA